MKKKAATKTTAPVAKGKTDDLASLVTEVRGLIQSARRGVASVVDTLQVMTNFEIGRRIVEHEQQGEKRAEYGKELLKELSARLNEEFGKGFSPVNLSYMKRFYLLWRDRVAIFQTPSEKLRATQKHQTLSVELEAFQISQTLSGKFKNPFTLSLTR